MTLAAENHEHADYRFHEPVMAREVCALLAASSPSLIVDATVGTGGHAAALLAATAARLFGLDRDAAALAAARARLAAYGSRVALAQGDFAELGALLAAAGLSSPGAILADLGMSSFALDDPARGFSLRHDGPLDMRMDVRQKLRAYDLVNEEPETELARILYEYGEERAARRIARLIAAARRRRPLESTFELRALVERALGVRRRGGVHPATRTFQALRIAVNGELASLDALLAAAPQILAPGGRLLIISYHSLEDRRVKTRFRELAAAGAFTLLTRKLMRPAGAELAHNPRARSARLRCVERSAGEAR